jgi:glutamate decarboxylase
LVDHCEPLQLETILQSQLSLPELGGGKEALLSVVRDALFKYSVNTWNLGFMDKLYGSTNAVGVISELLLAVLNTNNHVFQVSPVLTLVEKHTSRALAALFGFNGPHAGGVSQPGGSAANQSSIVIARNVFYPETKTDGYAGKKFVLFTSQHGHYSVEKAAQMFGFGSNAVWSVPVDEHGRMIPSELEALSIKARETGFTPFYVNATAGTTVLGSFDPLNGIADVCERQKLWLHVDGSYGGSIVFSDKLRIGRLDGSERADSVCISPHKMLGVPITCSFLLVKDLRKLKQAMTLPAA